MNERYEYFKKYWKNHKNEFRERHRRWYGNHKEEEKIRNKERYANKCKLGGVYAIINLIDGCCYIGASISIRSRWATHITLLRRKNHYNTNLQNAWILAGENNFKFQVLLYCESFELDRYEQFFVDSCTSSYNVFKEDVKNAKGVVHTPETRQKMGRKHRLSIKSNHSFFAKTTLEKFKSQLDKQLFTK